MNTKKTIQILAGVLAALSLAACAANPEEAVGESIYSDAPGKPVTSDTLHVQKVENLPEDFILTATIRMSMRSSVTTASTTSGSGCGTIPSMLAATAMAAATAISRMP